MLTIQYAKDPVWANDTNTAINLIVKFVEIADELPFTATPNDPMSYGVELFNNAVAGDYGVIAPYIPPEPVPPALDQPTNTGTQTI
jgi:hypothetical protein